MNFGVYPYKTRQVNGMWCGGTMKTSVSDINGHIQANQADIIKKTVCSAWD